MSRATVFVHGTGVRGAAYARSMHQVRRGLAGSEDNGALVGCFWGDLEGAGLNAGASVPQYSATAGPDQVDRELAFWSVLYADPWYELRLLSDRTDTADSLPPGRADPAAVLLEQVGRFRPSEALRSELVQAQLAQRFDRALESLRNSPELADAAETADPDLLAHRQAVARALIAHTQADPDEDGPVVDGATRDALVRHITTELDGYGRGVGDWTTRQVKGLASRALTRRLSRKRGLVTGAATPVAGDILRYQARGSGIRSAIRRSVLGTRSDEVTVLAHSLGGIASFDLLAMEPLPQVTRLITVGSQAPFLYEIGALVSLEPPAALPPHFPAWLNIYDPRDFLGFVGEALFPGRVTDIEVDNGQPFPQAHSSYWSNREVWRAIGALRS